MWCMGQTCGKLSKLPFANSHSLLGSHVLCDYKVLVVANHACMQV
jgi:hypothetical protein